METKKSTYSSEEFVISESSEMDMPNLLESIRSVEESIMVEKSMLSKSSSSSAPRTCLVNIDKAPLEVIGRGANSTVSMCFDAITGMTFAVKSIVMVAGSPEDFKSAREQAEIMRTLGNAHPNILGYYGYSWTQNEFNIYMEFMESKNNGVSAVLMSLCWELPHGKQQSRSTNT